MSRILNGNSGDTVVRTDSEVIKICGDSYESFKRQKDFLLKGYPNFIRIHDLNRHSYSMKYMPYSFTDLLYETEDLNLFNRLLDLIDSYTQDNSDPCDIDSYFAKLHERTGLIFKGRIFLPPKFGFCHGDLTFSNILLDDDMNFVLIDPRGTEESKFYDIGKIGQSVFMKYEALLDSKYDMQRLSRIYDRLGIILMKRYDRELIMFYTAVHLLGAVPFLKAKNRSYTKDFFETGIRIMKEIGIQCEES